MEAWVERGQEAVCFSHNLQGRLRRRRRRGEERIGKGGVSVPCVCLCLSIKVCQGRIQRANLETASCRLWRTWGCMRACCHFHCQLRVEEGHGTAGPAVVVVVVDGAVGAASGSGEVRKGWRRRKEEVRSSVWTGFEGDCRCWPSRIHWR